MSTEKKHLICIAPMLGYTHRHYRFFMRLLTHRTMLYTEMITANTLLHQTQRCLPFNEIEHPVGIQLAGDSPDDLAKSAKLAEDYQYDEINLNLGCPSERAQQGGFGACLMHSPQKILTLFKAIKEAVDIPVTVKIRLGLQADASYKKLQDFVCLLSEAGCSTFMIHARYAALNKSPRKNRVSHSLHYDLVYQLKKDFPALEIIMNGGIATQKDIKTHLGQTDGVMIGRAAYQDPYLFADVDKIFFNDAHPILTREKIFSAYRDYLMKQHYQHHVPLSLLIRPLFGLYKGCSGARARRQQLTHLFHKLSYTRSHDENL